MADNADPADAGSAGVDLGDNRSTNSVKEVARFA